MSPLVGFLFLGLICASVTWRTRDFFNPVNITGVGFFSNLLLARLKLSPMQPEQWAAETENILMQAWLFWFILPAVLLLVIRPRHEQSASARLAGLPPLHYRLLGRLLAVGVTGVYLFENWWLSSSFLPLLDPSRDVHTQYTSGIGIVTTSLGATSCLLEMVYFLKDRKRVDLLLMLLVLLLPLTRLARLDVILVAMSLIILFYYLGGARFWRLAVTVSIVVAILVALLQVVSIYRGSQGGLFDVDPGKEVGMVADEPLSGAAIHYYRYMALSFDSFDGLVRNTSAQRDHTYGLFTLRPLTLGVLRLHNLYDDYPTSSYLAERSDPVLRAKVIATGLSYFYLDFGYELIALPLCLYMALFLTIYLKMGGSVLLTSVYSATAAAFLLSSFTDLLSSPKLFYALVLLVAVLSINLRMLHWSPQRGPFLLVR